MALHSAAVFTTGMNPSSSMAARVALVDGNGATSSIVVSSTRICISSGGQRSRPAPVIGSTTQNSNPSSALRVWHSTASTLLPLASGSEGCGAQLGLASSLVQASSAKSV